MKKLLAISTLLAASSSLMAAETTSTKKIDVQDMSFGERSSVAYYGSMSKTKINGEGNDVSLANYIIMDYKVTNKLTANFTPVFSLKEGKKDGFAEGDPRFMLKYSTFTSADEKFSISHRIFLDAPTSKGSQESDKITQMRIYNNMSYKVDDLNDLTMWTMYNKTFNTKSEKSIDETSKYDIFNWLSYTNAYFSESVKVRADYDLTISQMKGAADTSLQNTEEVISLGADLDVLGVSIFPHVKMDVTAGSVVATDNLGMGMSMYKKF